MILHAILNDLFQKGKNLQLLKLKQIKRDITPIDTPVYC